MNNKLTIAGLVLAHVVAVLILTTVGGCRTAGQFDRNNDRGAFTGFPRDGGYIASTNPKSGAPAAAPVAQPVAEPVAQPVAAEPTAEPVGEVTAEKPVTAKPVSEPKPAGAGRTYTVKANESLWLIAKREGVTVAALTEANGFKKNATLKEGQKIQIPASSGKKPAATVGSSSAPAPKSAATAASGDTYVVKKGDVLSIVARKLGTTTAAIKAENNLKGDSIHEGQKLRIPAGASKKTSASSEKSAPAAKPEAPSKSAPAADTAAPAAQSVPGGLKELPLMGGAAPAAQPAAAPAAAPVAAPESVEAVPVSK